MGPSLQSRSSKRKMAGVQEQERSFMTLAAMQIAAGGSAGELVNFTSGMCQVFDSYVRSSNYALLAITELPNNELTCIHTLSLPPLLL